MTILKQLNGLKKLAHKFYDRSPEHFSILIAEIDMQLAEMREDNLLMIEALEFPDEVEQFDMREIA